MHSDALSDRPGQASETRQRVLEAVNRAVQDLQDRGDIEGATALAMLVLDWRRSWR
jgi:hypothetical protein